MKIGRVRLLAFQAGAPGARLACDPADFKGLIDDLVVFEVNLKIPARHRRGQYRVGREELAASQNGCSV
jgi:hypothetical protein